MSRGQRRLQMSTKRTGTSSSSKGSRSSTTNCFLIISHQGRVIFRKSVRLRQLQITLESSTMEKLGTWKPVILQFGQGKLVGWAGSQTVLREPQNGVKLTSRYALKRLERSGSVRGRNSTIAPQRQGSTSTASKHGIGGVTSLRFNANGLSRV